MNRVLAVDIGSGGVTVALVDDTLKTSHLAEVGWTLDRDAEGVATLSPRQVLDDLAVAVRDTTLSAAALAVPEACVLGSMMHTLLVTDADGTPRTPVFTWLATGISRGAETVRERLGTDYTLRTGAWFHPSFPSYTLARLRTDSPEVFGYGYRIHSLRSWIQFIWTGNYSEDTSTASASGLLNLESGAWDRATVDALGLDAGGLAPLSAPTHIVGYLSADRAAEIGLPASLPVVAGGGDGFLATLGSGCRSQAHLAITLGTTAAVRTFSPRPIDGSRSGMFCYRSSGSSFLVGCASNNGGNVLDWARREFGGEATGEEGADPPVFLPYVFGERAPFWDPSRRAEWHGISARHTPKDLAQSAREAVVFTLALYCRIIFAVLGTPTLGVLSGNGFAAPALAAQLQALVPFPLYLPREAGTATLRGAAITAFEGLGVTVDAGSEPPLERTVSVAPAVDMGDRFRRFADACGEPDTLSNNSETLI